MDSELPTASDLYNYDRERDDFPGLLIAKGGSVADESDPTKYQAWHTPPFAEALVIQGDTTVKLWSAMKDFDREKAGVVSVYLRDCEGWDCVELGGGTVSDSTWQRGSPSWVLKTLTFPVGPYTVAAGHSLELKVIVEDWSDDDMWFAYDTNDHKSRVAVSASAASPLAGSGVVVWGLVTRWLAPTGARLLFA